MEKKPIEIPGLTKDDFARLLPPNLVYPGLPELFGHYSRSYLKQIISKMNGYTWFRFVEAESKNLILKKMATRVLYQMINRESVDNICAGNENGAIYGEKAFGLSSRGVNYKPINEDGIGVFERDGLLSLVVCDGVGDCLVGEVASYVILKEFSDGASKDIAQIFSSSVDALTNLAKNLAEAIPEFVTFPNEISQAAVTAVQIKGEVCEVDQVGDVLFYHIRGDELRLLDQDRNWLSMSQLNHLFADEQYLAQRHIISNAVGRNYDPYWNPTSFELAAGDLVILASDGLETLHPREILELALREPDLKQLLHKLYQKAIDANMKWNTPTAPIYTKPDNISLILYRS